MNLTASRSASLTRVFVYNETTQILLEVDPVCASRELLYLAATGDRLQRLATMVAFRRLLCRGPGQPFNVWLLPMQALYELYLEHAEQPADDVLRKEGCLGLELLEHTCEHVDHSGDCADARVINNAAPGRLYASSCCRWEAYV
ncbi:hypothetical protein HPB51_011963 [Rhipicephalus microplus]|uniref:Uncharacterized protein n=1 Tax=Rhipicephalus microplus TaxID=6941 RepID=A0A9J6F3H0_RHIMP|nr:hypothetical protein HPB51_011963 [Rhipicephalus microplus]